MSTVLQLQKYFISFIKTAFFFCGTIKKKAGVSIVVNVQWALPFADWKLNGGILK